MEHYEAGPNDGGDEQYEAGPNDGGDEQYEAGPNDGGDNRMHAWLENWVTPEDRDPPPSGKKK